MNKLFLVLIAVVVLCFALTPLGCEYTQNTPAGNERTGNELPPPETGETETPGPDVPEEPVEPEEPELPAEKPAPPQIAGIVFVKENTDGTDSGAAHLLDAMKLRGIPFYQQGAEPGLISADDVVIIKINAQWNQRGGTNTDVIKSIVQYIIDHPGGFTGEVIIADNGQDMMGSKAPGNISDGGGDMDWPNPNSKDRKQSSQDVADYFDKQGWKVSAFLWDDITRIKVNEFETGDSKDGFVVEAGPVSLPVAGTGVTISYAKFTTRYGTQVSFKKGIWNSEKETYNSRSLKVINVPVLKSHTLCYVTGAMKSYMGIPSNHLTGLSAHNTVNRGSMGTLMINTRFPVLNILDMVWITPSNGPGNSGGLGSSYNAAVEKNMLAASTDPVALDYWASKNVLIPAVSGSNPSPGKNSMNPGGTTANTFGYWLRLSMNELKKGGYNVTMTEDEITVYTVE